MDYAICVIHLGPWLGSRWLGVSRAAAGASLRGGSRPRARVGAALGSGAHAVGSVSVCGARVSENGAGAGPCRAAAGLPRRDCSTSGGGVPVRPCSGRWGDLRVLASSAEGKGGHGAAHWGLNLGVAASAAANCSVGATVAGVGSSECAVLGRCGCLGGAKIGTGAAELLL
jgi:hypothetical protein